MTEINIKEIDNNRIKLDINGEPSEIINMLASAIIQNPKFGLLIMGAITVVAEHSKFPDINPN